MSSPPPAPLSLDLIDDELLKLIIQRSIIVDKIGKLKAAGILFGRSNIIAKFTRFLGKKIKTNRKYRILIAHANCKEKGIALEKQILEMSSL